MTVPFGPIGDLMKGFASTVCEMIQAIFGFFPF